MNDNVTKSDVHVRRHKNIVKNILKNHFRAEWINDAKRSQTGTNYLESAQFDCTIKHYLTLDLKRSDLGPLLKMTSGNHNLAVRTGSYRNRLEYEERICNLCNDGTIETVFHFICECSMYDDIRSQISPFLIDLTKQDFYGMLQKIDIGDVVKLSKFIKAANDIRTNSLLQSDTVA